MPTVSLVEEKDLKPASKALFKTFKSRKKKTKWGKFINIRCFIQIRPICGKLKYRKEKKMSKTLKGKLLKSFLNWKEKCLNLIYTDWLSNSCVALAIIVYFTTRGHLFFKISRFISDVE